MGKVADLIGEVRGFLRDADADQFDDAVIADAVYHGELALQSVKPEATSTDMDVETVEGSRQSLPDNAERLLDVRCNGTLAAPGRSIRMTARETLDVVTPDWRGAEPVESAREYLYDERLPDVFELSPPVLPGNVVCVVSLQPAKYGDIASGDLTVRDKYVPALIEWSLYRLFSEDSEGTVNEARSRKHYTNFFNFLGVKLQNEARVSPRQAEHKV